MPKSLFLKNYTLRHVFWHMLHIGFHMCIHPRQNCLHKNAFIMSQTDTCSTISLHKYVHKVLCVPTCAKTHISMCHDICIRFDVGKIRFSFGKVGSYANVMTHSYIGCDTSLHMWWHILTYVRTQHLQMFWNMLALMLLMHWQMHVCGLINVLVVVGKGNDKCNFWCHLMSSTTLICELVSPRHDCFLKISHHHA